MKKATIACIWIVWLFTWGEARSEETQVSVRLVATDMNGEVISTVTTGDVFMLKGYVQDKRNSPAGVFAAYFDVTITPADAVSVDGDIAYGKDYPNGLSGSTSTVGLIDEVGAFAGINVLDGKERLLFSIPLLAVSKNQVSFTANAADEHPAHDILVYGSNDPVPVKQIKYIGTTLTVKTPSGPCAAIAVPIIMSALLAWALVSYASGCQRNRFSKMRQKRSGSKSTWMRLV